MGWNAQCPSVLWVIKNKKVWSMYEQKEKTKENKNRSVGNSVTKKKSKSKHGFGFVDYRPLMIAQTKLKELASNSPQVKQLRANQGITHTGITAIVSHEVSRRARKNEWDRHRIRKMRYPASMINTHQFL